MLKLLLTVTASLMLACSLSAQIALLEENITLTGKQGSGILKKEIAFRNIGKTKIAVLGATASCGCMVSQIEKRTYAPDEKGSLSVEVNSAKSSHDTKKVLISTDDPKKPLIAVPIHIDIRR